MAPSLSRRGFLQLCSASALGLMLPQLASAGQRQWWVSGTPVPELAAYDRAMQTFMQDRNIPGGTLAVTLEGRLVLARGYSWIEDSVARLQPDSLFRIASLSKPITAAAILQLVEKGDLSLEQPLTSVLEPTAPAAQTRDPQVHDITLLHLLQHSAGWDRDLSFDPMFSDRRIARALDAELPISQADIIRYMSGQPLNFPPGQRYAYSNYGYCLLGRMIEAITGQPYAEAINQQIFAPLGITNMHLARSPRDQRLPGEVEYFVPGENKVESAVEAGQTVTLPYGGFNIENMDSHGGWVASAIEVARFLTAFDDTADTLLLSPSSLSALKTEPPTGRDSFGAYYGAGWMVRPLDEGRHNLWHFGMLPGSYTYMVNRQAGPNAVALFNQAGDASGLDYTAIDGLLRRAGERVGTWPTHDFFPDFQPS